MKLTQEEKTRRLALAMPNGFLEWPLKGGPTWCLNDVHRVFDPFNDLNACHEMEKAVLIAPFSGPENDTASGSERLCIQLEDYIKNLHGQYFGMGSPWHYAAAQRAEAFGPTLNLWKAGE